MKRIDDETDLREFYGKEPSERALKKVINKFDRTAVTSFRSRHSW